MDVRKTAMYLFSGFTYVFHFRISKCSQATNTTSFVFSKPVHNIMVKSAQTRICEEGVPCLTVKDALSIKTPCLAQLSREVSLISSSVSLIIFLSDGGVFTSLGTQNTNQLLDLDHDKGLVLILQHAFLRIKVFKTAEYIFSFWLCFKYSVKIFAFF